MDLPNKKYDLEKRTFQFAQDVLSYTGKLPKSPRNVEISRQLIRSAGSVGANYIEANEALSKKDFLMRIKISRKEAKESEYWLRLTEPDPVFENDKLKHLQEALELRKIFGAIIEKSK